jgi:hypothetical protein
MKENDGRGARRRNYMKYAIVVAAGLVGFLCLLSLAFPLLLASTSISSSSFSSSNGNNQWTTSNDRMMLRQPSHGLLHHNRRPHAAAAQRQADQTDSSTADFIWQGILEGHLHLMDIRPSARGLARMFHQENVAVANNKSLPLSYRGAFVASFCHLDWTLPKADPSTTPMFRFLVEKSPDCDHPYKLDLYDVVEKVYQFDHDAQVKNSKDNGLNQKKAVKLLNLTGVVFHESRCGSTLVANVLAGMNPAQHRVYSESSPPIAILRMIGDNDRDEGERDGTSTLSVPQAAEILKHVIYLMSRSNDFQEERVFFKIQSIGTRSLNVFQQAFPTTPWIFVYRDPVQVMMSHLGGGASNNKLVNARNANCVRPQKFPPRAVERIVAKYTQQQQRARDLSYQDFCAAHLASLTETALKYMGNNHNNGNSSEGIAVPVNYNTLPDIMWTDILPNRWHVPTGPDDIQRMQLVATQYSKQGKGGPKDRGGVEFTGDSQEKEKAASPAIRAAAQRYLQPSFEALEKLANAKMH